MKDRFFVVETCNDVTSVRCKFCRSIRWVGVLVEGAPAKHVPVCTCDDAWLLTVETLRARPAIVDLNPDSRNQD